MKGKRLAYVAYKMLETLRSPRAFTLARSNLSANSSVNAMAPSEPIKQIGDHLRLLAIKVYTIQGELKRMKSNRSGSQTGG